MALKVQSQFEFVKTAQDSVKTGHVYLNIYSDQADGEIGIIASMFKEMADAFSQIEGTDWAKLGPRPLGLKQGLITARRAENGNTF